MKKVPLHYSRKPRKTGIALRGADEKRLRVDELRAILLQPGGSGNNKDYREILKRYGIVPPDFHWYTMGITHWCNMETYALQVTEVYRHRTNWAIHAYSSRLKKGSSPNVEMAKKRAERIYMYIILSNPHIPHIIEMEMNNGKMADTVQVQELRSDISRSDSSG